MEQQMYKEQIDAEQKSYQTGTTNLQIPGEYKQR